MYTKEFIESVKRCYPNSEEIIRLAEEGSYFLGRYLDDSSSDAVSTKFILTHTPEEVKQRAVQEKERRDLYHLWSSGACYGEHGEREVYCPANWLQNNNDPRRYELTEQICRGSHYVSYYPACERYGCKQKCWEKYDALISSKKTNDR